MKLLCYFSIVFTILIVNISSHFLRKKGAKPGISREKYRILSVYLQVISNIVLIMLLICFSFLFYNI